MTTDREARLTGAAVATGWLVVMVALDVTAGGSDLVFTVFFALAPLIACAVLSPLVTAVFTVASVAAAVGAGWWNGAWDSSQQLVRVADVALIGVAAIVIAVARVRREQRLARLTQVAEVAQRAILPSLPSTAGQVAIRARYVSAAQDALIGGDLYDFFHSDARARFVVGDVRGKGIVGIEQAARVIRAFRQFAGTGPSLAGVARDMSAYLAPFFDDEEFVTALLVESSDPTRLTLVSCGHPAPVHVSRDGSATFLDLPPGLPLGLGDVYDSVTVPWAQSERLLVYTDGLSEARDARGRYFALTELGPVLAEAKLDDALDTLLSAVHRHVPKGRLMDDVAVMLLENSSVQAPTPRSTGALFASSTTADPRR